MHVMFHLRVRLYHKFRPYLPMTPEYHIDYTDSQLPVSDNHLYAEGHVSSVMDPQYPETFTA